jgi:hypothetical protein
MELRHQGGRIDWQIQDSQGILVGDLYHAYIQEHQSIARARELSLGSLDSHSKLRGPDKAIACPTRTFFKQARFQEATFHRMT